MIVFQMIIWIICFEFLNLMCWFFGEEATVINNYYSLNHIRYNTLYLKILLEVCGLVILGITLRKNFGIKHRKVNWLFYLVNIAFTTLRAIFLIFALYRILP